MPISISFMVLFNVHVPQVSTIKDAVQ